MTMHGQVKVFYSRREGEIWEMVFEFQDEAEMTEIFTFFDAHKNRFAPTTTPQEISLIPKTAKGVAEKCPRHGTEHLRADRNERGHYCAAKVGDGFCGWQSWK
jgi:hypothetical protein